MKFDGSIADPQDTAYIRHAFSIGAPDKTFQFACGEAGRRPFVGDVCVEVADGVMEGEGDDMDITGMRVEYRIQAFRGCVGYHRDHGMRACWAEHRDSDTFCDAKIICFCKEIPLTISQILAIG